MTHHTTIILGIDGGASKTVAILADGQGKPIARYQTAGTNKQVSGIQATLTHLYNVIEGVFRQADLPMQRVASACFGLSGVDRPSDITLMRSWADSYQIAERLTIVNDARLVLAAGTPDGHGVGLICGTGSIAFGRKPDGEMSRAGGWGYILGDEGSGYDIAIQAMRAATQAIDGRGTAFVLRDALMEKWHITNPQDLIPFVYEHPNIRQHMLEVPLIVSDLAEIGDSHSVAILDHAAQQLADIAVAAARQLKSSSTFPLAIAGSVILKTPLLQQALRECIQCHGYTAEPITPVEDPALGALRLAREQLHS